MPKRFRVLETGELDPVDGAPGDPEGSESIELGMPALNSADEAIGEHLGNCSEAGEGNLLEAQRNIDNARSNLRQHAMTAHHADVAGDDDGPADAAITESYRRRSAVTLSLRERAPRRTRPITIDCLEAR